jgi:hypothetical protein
MSEVGNDEIEIHSTRVLIVDSFILSYVIMACGCRLAAVQLLIEKLF